LIFEIFRAIRGVISSKEQAALFHHLLTLNHNELIAIHNKVHDAMTLSNDPFLFLHPPLFHSLTFVLKKLFRKSYVEVKRSKSFNNNGS